MTDENNLPDSTETNENTTETNENAAPADSAGEFEYDGEKFQIPDQFFDRENNKLKLGALLKSQSDLRRQIGQASQAPEKYTFGDLDEENDNLLIKALDAFGHGGKIPQDKMDELVSALSAAGAEFRENVRKEAEAEFSRLFAADAQKTTESVAAWVNGLIGDKVGDDPALRAAVDGIARDPYAVFIINAVKNAVKTGNASPSSAGTPAAGGVKSEDELDAMVRNPKYKTDPEYRKKVEAEFRRKYG